MPVSRNRRERRAAAKIDKTPWNLRLMEYSGHKVTAGVYYDIMQTPWRGAEKCSYEYRAGTTWFELIASTKFYFAPVTDKFEANVSTSWSNNTRMLFTVNGGNMTVNITFKRDDGNHTLTLLLPGCIMDMDDVEKLVQKKSSSLFQLALNSWRNCVKNYTQEQRNEMCEEYKRGGHDELWSRIMSGLYPLNGLEAQICTALIGDVLTPLLQVFRTLAFMDYTIQSGNLILEDSHTLSLTANSIARIEAICTSNISPVSNVSIGYRDSDADGATIEGNLFRFYDVYSDAMPPRVVEWLACNVIEKKLDIAEVTACSVGRYVYIDKCGNPMSSGSHESRDLAQWMLTATGLHSKVGEFAVFGLYKKSPNQDSQYLWDFERFDMAHNIYKFLEKEEDVKGMLLERWEPLFNKKFEIVGVGLRSSLPEERNNAAEVRYYDCSKEVLERLMPGSNIKTLDQMNYFIEAFLRMLRRRKMASVVGGLYCTGLIDKDGNYMWLHCSNLASKFDRLQPDLVSIRDVSSVDATGGDTSRFFRDSKYLLMESDVIKVDENSLLHVTDDREYRIPPNLASLSKPQLMDWIRDSISYTKLMMHFNPLFAQPCYSERLDKICHLIPLYAEHKHDIEHLAGALFVNKGRVATIYTVEMARDYACLFNIPKATWLPD